MLWIKNDDGLVDVFNVRKHVLDYKPEGFDEKTPLGPRYIEVMRVEDHERIVAEKDAEIERLKRANQVVPKDAELLALNGKFRDTIATQARVIEKLKVINRDFAWHYDECSSIVEDNAPCDCGLRKIRTELAAIEKGVNSEQQ